MILRLIFLLSIAVVSGVLQAQVRIVDPVPGAYVSGAYEILLNITNPDKAVKTELLVNEKVVFEDAGPHSGITHDFGEAIAVNDIYARVTYDNGEVLLSDTVTTKPLEFDYEETTRLILLGVVVKTKNNRPLVGLKQDQFRIFEDNKPLEIKAFYKEKLPLDLVFLLDTSSSLRETGMPELKHASKEFLKNLAPQDRVSLIEFKNKPNELTPFTNDHKKMNAAIDGLYPKGATALFDGLLEAVEALETRKSGRKAIVLFTDGRDSVYEEPLSKARALREAISRAQNREITVFTIGLGKRLNEAALHRIADESGGRYHFADKPERLAAIFTEIIQDLKNQYMIGVSPQASKAGFHGLRVEVTKRRARVYARKGYSLE